MFPLLRVTSLLVLLAVAGARGAEPNEKAERYYVALKKRPAAGAVFDRFVDAWLDTATLEELEQFLKARADAQPPAAEDRVMLALYYSRQGSLPKAVQAYREALKLDPENALLWQQKAVTEARLLEFDPALASVASALSKKPPAEVALSLRQLQGRLLARAGRTEEAINVWQKLLEERPDDEPLREDVMELQLAAGLTDAAAANALRLVEQAPDAYKMAMRRLQMAVVLERAEKTDAALEELEKCLADSGAGSWLEKEVLAKMEQIHRSGDAITSWRSRLEKLIALYPQRQEPRRARVRLLAELGEKESAVAAGRELLALAPGDRTGRDEFISLLLKAGDIREAVAQLSELVRQSPGDYELLLRLAALKLQAGDKPGCLETLTQYDSASGGTEAARLRSAAVLEKAGLAAESARRLEAALPHFPASFPLRSALASAWHRSGSRDEAIKLWRELAAEGSPLLEVARAVSAHGEEVAARDILASAAGGSEVPLLMLWCQLSERTGAPHPAIPAARRLVTLAKSAEEGDAAVDLAARIIGAAGDAENVIQSIGPGSTAAELCLRAQLLENRGDHEQAEAALMQAARESPEMAAPRLIGVYRQKEQWDQALEAGTRLFESPGGKKAALAQLLAETAERGQRWEAALRWNGEWRRLSPGFVAAVLAEVKVLRVTGRDADAVRTLRLAAAQFEENGAIRTALAQLFRDTGRSGEAMTVYAALYDQAKDNAAKRKVLKDWAAAALASSRLGELEEHFLERKRQNTGSSAPLLGLAEIYGISAQRQKQCAALRSAARLHPEDIDTALELAGILRGDSLPGEAKDVLQMALPHDKSQRVRRALAAILVEEGDQEAGLKLMEETLAGGDASAVEELAMSLTLMDPRRALALLAARLAVDPADYRLQFLRARIFIECSRTEEAVKELAPLLAIRLENPAMASRRSGSAFSANMQALISQLAGIVPEEILDVLRVQDAAEEASRPQWSPSAAGAGITVARFHPQLPGDLTELRAMTAAALLSFSGDSGPEADKAMRALIDGGLGGAGALLFSGDENEDPFSRTTGARPLRTSLLPDGGRWQSTTLPEELVGGISGLRLLLGQRDSASLQFVQKAASKWFVSHPDFGVALMFITLSSQAEESPSEHQAIEAFVKMEHPHSVVLSAAAHYLLPEENPVPRSGDQHRRILERVTGWLESGWIAVPTLEKVRQRLAAGVLANGTANPDLAARVMNAEWPREAHGSPVGGVLHLQTQMPPVSGSAPSPPEGFLTALAWPPSIIPGVSPVFAAQAGNRQVIHGINHGAVATILTQLKDPVLRARMEDYATKASHPLPSLTKLAEAPDASPSALLLAAITCAEGGEFEKAVPFAVRLLESPLPGKLRRQVNASIIVWAEDIAPAPGTPLFTAASEAALRLRREAVTDSQKLELASAMDWLGLNGAAAELRNVTALGGGVFNRAGRVRADARAARVQVMMKQALWDIQSGVENAHVMIARLFLRRAQLALSPGGWDEQSGELSSQFATGSTEEELKWPEFVRTVQRDEALVARVLEYAKQPRDQDATHRQALVAAIAEMLGRREMAVVGYRQAIQAGCSDPGVHVRLCQLLAQDEPEMDRAFFAAPAVAQEWVMGSLLEGGPQEPFEKIMRGARLARGAAQTMDPASASKAAWLGKVLVLTAGEINLPGGVQAQRLEGPSDEEVLDLPGQARSSAADPAKTTALLAERRQACEALARALVKVPPVAALAFTTLHRISPPGTDLSAEAVAACVAGCLAPGPPVPLNSQQAMYARLTAVQSREAGRVFAVMGVPDADPSEALNCLLQAAVKSQHRELLDNLLAGALESAGFPAEAEVARMLGALYFGPGDQVNAVASKLFTVTGSKKWPQVIRGLEYRKVKVDLNSAVEGELSRAGLHPEDLPDAAAAAGDYLLWLCRDGRRDEARVLLCRMVELLAGAQGQRLTALAAVLEAGSAARRGSHTPAAVPVPAQQMLLQLRRLAGTPESSGLALDVLYSEFIPFLPDGLAQECALQVKAEAFVSLEFLKTDEGIRRFFEGNPMVAGVEQFRSFGGQKGVFAGLARSIHDLRNEDRQRVIRVLQGLPPAFGRDLLMAVVEQGGAAAAERLAGDSLERLRQLPPGNQVDIAEVLLGLQPIGSSAGSPPVDSPLQHWVKEQHEQHLKRQAGLQVEAWLAQPAAPILQADDVGEVIAPASAAIFSASPRTAEVFQRAATLTGMSEAPAVMEALLTGTFQRIVEDGESAGSASRWLGIATGLFSASDKRVPLFSEELRGIIPTAVQALIPPGTSAGGSFKSLVEVLAPAVGPGYGSLLMEAFPLPVTEGVTPEQRRGICQKAVAWASGEGKSLARQDLVQEIASAAQLELSAGVPVDPAGPLPSEQAHYLSVLQDESRGLGIRLAVAGVLADYAGDRLHPRVVAAAARVLEISAQQGIFAAPWQRSAIMTALADAAPSTECTEAARRIVTVMAGTREFTKLNDRVVQRSLLRLALKADHGGMVADLLAALQAEGGDPDVMGDILASGNAVRVSNLAVDINTVYYSSEFVSGKVTFDARVDAALAAVLPTIDPPALRLRFELSAHCLPSAPGMKPRVERLQEIARRLSPLLDSLDASALNNDLELLAVEPAAALLLRRCYDERCPEEEWAGILRQSADPSAGNVWTFWMIGLFADAAEPNLPQLSKRATAFQIKSGAFLYYACAGISHGWPQWKQETRSEVERWLRATLDKSSNLLTEEGREALRKLPAELHTAVKIYF